MFTRQSILFMLVLTGTASLAAQDDRGLTSEQSSADRREEGERLALGVSKARQSLPKRWAALVRYEIVSTPDANEFQLTKGSNYVAEDRNLKIKVERRKEVDADLTDFPREWYGWRSGSEKLVKHEGKWVLMKTQIDLQHCPFLDPFMLCLSSPGSYQRGITENEIELKLFSQHLSCLGIKETKRGREVVWGGGATHRSVDPDRNSDGMFGGTGTMVFAEGTELPQEWEVRLSNRLG